MKVKFIDGARYWYRYWSVRLWALGTAFIIFSDSITHYAIQTFAILPDDIRAGIDPEFVRNIGTFAVVVGGFARFIQQQKLKEQVDSLTLGQKSQSDIPESDSMDR